MLTATLQYLFIRLERVTVFKYKKKKTATFDFKERRNKEVSPLSTLMTSVHYKECAKKVLL